MNIHTQYNVLCMFKDLLYTMKMIQSEATFLPIKLIIDVGSYYTYCVLQSHVYMLCYGFVVMDYN